MEILGRGRKEFEEFSGVFAGVDNAEGLRCGGEFGSKGLIGEIASIGDINSGKICEELLSVLDDFLGIREADGEVVRLGYGGLGGGAEDRGSVVVT